LVRASACLAFRVSRGQPARVDPRAEITRAIGGASARGQPAHTPMAPAPSSEFRRREGDARTVSADVKPQGDEIGEQI
jgi:hypothetical protein